jgi:hypothetical protein
LASWRRSRSGRKILATTLSTTGDSAVGRGWPHGGNPFAQTGPCSGVRKRGRPDRGLRSGGCDRTCVSSTRMAGDGFGVGALLADCCGLTGREFLPSWAAPQKCNCGGSWTPRRNWRG